MHDDHPRCVTGNSPCGEIDCCCCCSFVSRIGNAKEIRTDWLSPWAFQSPPFYHTALPYSSQLSFPPGASSRVPAASSCCVPFCYASAAHNNMVRRIPILHSLTGDFVLVSL